MVAATPLASLKFSRLFRYDYVDHPDAKLLIDKYRKRLAYLQQDNERENAKRKAQGLLAYRYLQPVEVPESIAI